MDIFEAHMPFITFVLSSSHFEIRFEVSYDFICVLLGIEPIALHTPGIYSTTELNPQPHVWFINRRKNDFISTFTRN